MINSPENKSLKDSLTSAIEKENWETYASINDSIEFMAKEIAFEKYQIPRKHRDVYHSIGGTPHLDQNYTVFGRVIRGMNVVDSIAAQPVNDQNRPIEKLQIITAKVIRN